MFPLDRALVEKMVMLMLKLKTLTLEVGDENGPEVVSVRRGGGTSQRNGFDTIRANQESTGKQEDVR